MLDEFRRFLGPVNRRIRLMISRAVMQLIDDSGSRQVLQVSGVWNELLAGVEHFQQYGFTAHAHPGAEGLLLSVGGQRQASVVITVEDRRYRMTALAEGEVALYDDLGQTVHLTRGGIVVSTPSKITMIAPSGIRFQTPQLEVTGDILDQCDSGNGQTMASMRQTYDGHTHPVANVQGGSATVTSNVPNQHMAGG